MVMKLHTGVPGAGKTFFLIKSLTDLFYAWNEELNRFELKPEHQNLIVISNVEGLNLDHKDLDSLISDRCLTLAKRKFTEQMTDKNLPDMDELITEYFYDFKSESIRWFFNYDYQERLCDEFGPVVYVIEEAQRYFDGQKIGREKWLREVLFFFEKHRHLGISIFMDTQHESKLHKGVAVLFESQIEAKPRTLSVMGEFRYNEYVDGAKVNQLPIIAKADTKIFSAYKSMNVKEGVKTKKPIARLLIFIGIMAVGSLIIFRYAINHLGGSVVQAKPITKNDSKPSNSSQESSISTKSNNSNSTQKNEITESWQQVSYYLIGKDLYIFDPVVKTFVHWKDINKPVRKIAGDIFMFLPDPVAPDKPLTSTPISSSVSS